MSNIFKRQGDATARPAERAASNKTSSPAKERRLLPRPLPTPEVVEGNEDSDWSLWQESVAFQDSQMQPGWFITEPVPIQGAAPSKESEFIDPFASVHKNSK